MLENMDLNKILQYVALTIAIYLVFKYVPSQPLNDKEIIIITVIVALCCILLESIVGPTKKEKEQICSTVCANKKIEGMTLDEISKNAFGALTQITSQIAPTQILSEEKTTQSPVMDYTSIKNEVDKLASINQTQMPISDQPSEYEKMKETSEKMMTTELNKPDVLPSTIDSYYSALYPPTFYKLPKSGNIERVGSRAEQDLMRSDMPYNDYNHIPIPKDYVSTSTDYGYSFLPPEKWYPEPPNPPICVTEKRCPVVPLYTTGTNIELKEWDDSRKMLPPDNINTKYVKEVLNAGR